MQLSIQPPRLSVRTISVGDDVTVDLNFEAKNQAPSEEVAFAVRIGNTVAKIFLLNDDGTEVKEVTINKKVGKQWGKQSIQLRFRLKSTPKEPIAALIILFGTNSSGGTDKEYASLICY